MTLIAVAHLFLGLVSVIVRFGCNRRHDGQRCTQLRRIAREGLSWLAFLCCCPCWPAVWIIRRCTAWNAPRREAAVTGDPEIGQNDEGDSDDKENLTTVAVDPDIENGAGSPVQRCIHLLSARWCTFSQLFVLKWYWVHLAGTAGFMYREFQVITMLDGWQYLEVSVAHFALWVVFLQVAWQVWRFSRVRTGVDRGEDASKDDVQKDRIASKIDQVLDMLMLPINFGFLCAVTVRMLKLEDTPENVMIAASAIDCADMWESWALWSVLKLFVKIVDSRSLLDVEGRLGQRGDYQRQRDAYTPPDSTPIETPPTSSRRSRMPSSVPCGSAAAEAAQAAHADASASPPSPCSAALSPQDETAEVSPAESDVFADHLSTPDTEEGRQDSEHCVVTDAEGSGLPREVSEEAGDPEVTGTQASRIDPPSLPSPPDVPRWRRSITPTDSYFLGLSPRQLRPVWTQPSSASRQDDGFMRTGRRYLNVVSTFKRVSLMGVQAWVFLLAGSNLVEIAVKGVLSPRLPTWCYWLYMDCLSCSDWYDLHIYPVAQGIIFVLCSLALIFVVAFEQAFSDYLRIVEPYWKFLGVKCVVSITYVQWLLIRHCMGLSDAEVYIYHCLVCCIEMPLLCVLHTYRAYQFGHDQPWLQDLLEADKEGMERLQWAPFDDLCCIMSGVNHMMAEDLRRLCGVGWWALTGLASCWMACRLVGWVVPAEYDAVGSEVPWYNFTCQDDVQSFLKQHPHKMAILPARRPAHPQARGPPQQHYRPRHVRGTWLPLCETMPLSCPSGYKGEPAITCGSDRQLQAHGGCEIVGCGPPLQYLHASPVIEGRTVWTTGMHVHYQCDEGFHGRKVAVCTWNGTWSSWQWLEGKEYGCTLVGCGALETFLYKEFHGLQWRNTMMLVSNKSLSSSHLQEKVHFQCLPGLRGNPVATCIKGQWSLSDRCEHFHTSERCRCKSRWTECRGWLHNDCRDQFGCASNTSEPFDWCQVEPGSCPTTARNWLGGEPGWDYCVDDNFGRVWLPEPLDDSGMVISEEIIVCGAAVILCALALLYIRWRTDWLEAGLESLRKMQQRCTLDMLRNLQQRYTQALMEFDWRQFLESQQGTWWADRLQSFVERCTQAWQSFTINSVSPASWMRRSSPSNITRSLSEPLLNGEHSPAASSAGAAMQRSHTLGLLVNSDMPNVLHIAVNQISDGCEPEGSTAESSTGARDGEQASPTTSASAAILGEELSLRSAEVSVDEAGDDAKPAESAENSSSLFGGLFSILGLTSVAEEDGASTGKGCIEPAKAPSPEDGESVPIAASTEANSGLQPAVANNKGIEPVKETDTSSSTCVVS